MWASELGKPTFKPSPARNYLVVLGKWHKFSGPVPSSLRQAPWSLHRYEEVDTSFLVPRAPWLQMGYLCHCSRAHDTVTVWPGIAMDGDEDRCYNSCFTNKKISTNASSSPQQLPPQCLLVLHVLRRLLLYFFLHIPEKWVTVTVPTFNQSLEVK